MDLVGRISLWVDGFMVGCDVARFKICVFLQNCVVGRTVGLC